MANSLTCICFHDISNKICIKGTKYVQFLDKKSKLHQKVEYENIVFINTVFKKKKKMHIQNKLFYYFALNTDNHIQSSQIIKHNASANSAGHDLGLLFAK